MIGKRPERRCRTASPSPSNVCCVNHVRATARSFLQGGDALSAQSTIPSLHPSLRECLVPVSLPPALDLPARPALLSERAERAACTPWAVRCVTRWASYLRRRPSRLYQPADPGTRTTSGDDTAMVQAPGPVPVHRRLRALSARSRGPSGERHVRSAGRDGQGVIGAAPCYYLAAYSTNCPAPVAWGWTRRCARCARRRVPTTEPPRSPGMSSVTSR